MRFGLLKARRLFHNAFPWSSIHPDTGSSSNPQRSLEAGFAVARAVVVLSVPLAISQKPVGDGLIAMPASTLAALYSLYAAGIILAVVTLGRKPAPFVVVAIHLADIFWAFSFAALIDSFGPAFLLLVFPLITATLRWGPSATLATTLALVATLQASIPAASIGTDLHSYIVRFQTPASVILLGILFAHISHRHRQNSQEEQIFEPTLPAGSPAQIVETVFQQAFTAFRAKHIELLVEEYNTGRTFLWHADRQNPSMIVHSEEFDYSSAEPYLRLMPPNDWVLRRNGTKELLYTKEAGGKARAQRVSLPVGFTEYFNKYSIVVSAVIQMGDEWQGRLIVCEPQDLRSNQAIWKELRAFSENAARCILTAQICLRACRDTAAEERARLARELHDGVIQSLLGVDLRLESLKRHADMIPAREDLCDVQNVLRREAMGLRQMVNDSRRKALSPERLLEYVSDLLERFQRDTGMTTHFFADLDTDRMPARICHEIARITEECLVNTHKHSNASSLTVRVGSVADNWLIVVVDDGVGFDFQGVWSLERLAKAGIGPNVIKDRVKTLNGDLLIESTPTGARIEITIPKTMNTIRDVLPRRLRNDTTELIPQRI